MREIFGKKHKIINCVVADLHMTSSDPGVSGSLHARCVCLFLCYDPGASLTHTHTLTPPSSQFLPEASSNCTVVFVNDVQGWRGGDKKSVYIHVHSSRLSVCM